MAETLPARIHALSITDSLSRPGDLVTISLGVAGTVPDREASPADLVAAADQTLYQAKQEGRNRVKTHPTMSVKKKTHHE